MPQTIIEVPTNIYKSKIELLPYQNAATDLLLQGIITNTPKLLIAPTRTGKTYSVVEALARAQSKELLKKSTGMINILILTTKSVKTQYLRVCREAGLEGVAVENYATLRATLGGLFVDWIKTIEYGSLAEKPVWRTEDKPDIIICDECQMVKNSATLQAKIIQSAAEAGILIIFTSATPFVTLADAKVLCIGLRVTDEHNWLKFINGFEAQGTDFRQPSPKSSNNLKEFLESKNRIVRFTNIKYKHRVFNRCVLIDFSSEAKRIFYERTWLDYLEECRKIDKSTPQGIRALWVLNQKQRVRAEDIRKEELADYAYDIQIKLNRQVILGSNFINTLRGIWKQLVKVHKVSPDRIGFLVGALNDQKRQKYIDDFQNGKLDYMLLTLKCGGAGISLHHDRPEGRRRYCILPPTWSPIELIQVLGRAHGPTSLTPTNQDVLWLKGTIEERVATKVAAGFSCLGELVNRKETWVNLFNELTEEESKKIDEIYNEEQVEVNKESGEEILFSAEAFENSSVE